MSKKKTKTIKVTCRKCGRVVRVSKGSVCAMTELCYACVNNVEERSDVDNGGKKDE